jgi:Recombination endonuclease VII
MSTERYRKSERGQEIARAYSRHYYHTVSKFNPVEVNKRRKANSLNHYRKYGLTFDEAVKLKARGCGLCGTKIGKMNIDHNHNTGKVRGVLCNPCNLMIGWIERAESRMADIQTYLKKGL